jgi:hypothetical protein
LLTPGEEDAEGEEDVHHLPQHREHVAPLPTTHEHSVKRHTERLGEVKSKERTMVRQSGSNRVPGSEASMAAMRASSSCCPGNDSSSPRLDDDEDCWDDVDDSWEGLAVAFVEGDEVAVDAVDAADDVGFEVEVEFSFFWPGNISSSSSSISSCFFIFIISSSSKQLQRHTQLVSSLSSHTPHSPSICPSPCLHSGHATSAN